MGNMAAGHSWGWRLCSIFLAQHHLNAYKWLDTIQNLFIFLHFSFLINKLRRESLGDRFPSKGIPRDDCKAVHYFTRSKIFLLICPPPIVRPTRFTFFEYGTTYYNALWSEMGYRVRLTHMYILIWNGRVTMDNRRNNIIIFFFTDLSTYST